MLFLGARSVIHGLLYKQDLRKIGGLRRLVPFTYAIIGLSFFLLTGLFFLTEFYFKDAIFEVAYSKYTVYGHFSYLLGSFGAFCTAFYSLRLIYLCFLSSPNAYHPFIVIKNVHESSIWTSFPLVFLTLLSIPAYNFFLCLRNSLGIKLKVVLFSNETYICNVYFADITSLVMTLIFFFISIRFCGIL